MYKRRSKQSLDIYKYLIIHSVVLIVPYFIPYGYEIACAVLIVWMLKGPLYVMQGLSLVVLIKYLNPAIVEQGFAIGMLGWAAVLVAAARSIFSLKIKMHEILVPLSFFVLIVVILSVIVSPRLDVSLMKVLAFWVFISSILICSLSLKIEEIYKLKSWLICLFVVIVVLSIPMYFIPSIGFNRNAAGFQGIVNHPQAFGTMLAPFATWLISGLVIDKKKLPKWLWGLLLVIIVCMFLSQARTSILAFALAVFFGFVVGLLKDNIRVDLLKSLYMGVVFSVFFVLAVSLSSEFRNSVFGFVLKQNDVVNTQVDSAQITEEFTSSRGIAIKSHWRSFLSSPIAGTGYGVYPSGEFFKPVVYYHGIPISASVEKGFLPSMILEEIGLVGALAFLFFLIKLSKYVFNNYEVKWIAMYLSCLLTNLGEATLFAVNGISQWYWLLIALCVAHGVKARWMAK